MAIYLTRLTPFLGALSSLDLQEFTVQGRDACVERVPWRPRLVAGFRAKKLILLEYLTLAYQFKKNEIKMLYNRDTKSHVGMCKYAYAPHTRASALLTRLKRR